MAKQAMGLVMVHIIKLKKNLCFLKQKILKNSLFCFFLSFFYHRQSAKLINNWGNSIQAKVIANNILLIILFSLFLC